MKKTLMKPGFVILTIILFLLAIIVIPILTGLVATYLTPIFADKQWIAYVLLIVAALFFLKLKRHLNKETIFNNLDPENLDEIEYQGIVTPRTSRPKDHGIPTPKINPLPTNIYGKIAFLREKDNRKEYVIANSDGSGQFVITRIDWNIYGPRIAPGGEKVVFSSAHEGQESIYIINPDSSNLKRLTGPARTKRDGYASWSPDGTRLIYFREYSHSNDIYIMNSNGSDQVNLTDIHALGNMSLNSFTEFPWSPDGNKIVFASNRSGHLKICIMDKDGKNIRQITNNSKRKDYGAVWAPNRNTIAYVSTEGIGDQTAIFTLDLDSPKTKPVNITKNLYHNTCPVWSPDGTQILFVSNRDADSELYIMNSNGRNVRRITHTAERKDNPSWLR